MGLFSNFIKFVLVGDLLVARKRKKMSILLIFVFIIYLAALVYFVFFAEEYGRTEISNELKYNLMPFQEIKRYIEYRAMIGMPAVILNLLGNVVAFIPFGFLLPMISSAERRSYMIFFLSLELSLIIEVIQLFTRVGSFDVDDLILNTLGGLIGYWAYRTIRGFGKKLMG